MGFNLPYSIMNFVGNENEKISGYHKKNKFIESRYARIPSIKSTFNH